MKYETLGNLIKTEREKRGWEQSTLASMLKVGQQAVSRWEKGGSHPRRDSLLKMVDLFGIKPEDLLPLAGYEPEAPDTSLVHFLPLSNLSPEKFELFCRDLIQSLNPGAEVDRYGLLGDNQDGIDLFAKKKAKVLDYQCKRHKQFGPENVKAVIAATTFKAKHHHLLLSRPATRAAKDEIINLPNWSFWDRDIISAKVRALPKDDAIRLVDIYFQGYRKRFLGIENPSPWLTSEEFYRPYVNRKTLFNHSWNFYGRAQELKMLHDFKDKDELAIIVSGRGGIGKSRLIKAWADEESKFNNVKILSSNADIRPQDFESLPEGKSFIVIDDAHDRNDMITVTSGIFRYRPEAKIILTTRPYGVPKLSDELSKAGVTFNQEDTIELNSLDLEAAQQLANQILTDVSGATTHAKRIAEITRDCPLATVVGSTLVGQGKIKPELLNNIEEFRAQLLKSFRNIIAGEIGKGEPEIIKELLDLISMIQPINPTSPAFQKVAQHLLKRRTDKTVRDVRSLEEAGILLRRSKQLRIVPDLLGDYIRSEASYNEKSHISTHYADIVFSLLENELATNFLANISQLDWKLAEGGAQESLLFEVWKNLKSQFQKAKIFERAAILSALEKVSYYQPKQVLKFIRMALEEPTEDVEKEHIELSFRKPNYQYVIQKLPPLLKYVAYHEDYLFEALDLLKKLAEHDMRATNPHPEHPLRVLQDLASIEPGKPGAYNEVIANHVIGWLKEDGKGNFSPFDVLDVLLRTEGHQTESKGAKITFKPFKIRAEAVAGIRKKIIEQAFNTVKTGVLRDALRALKTIEAGLSYPSGLLGQSISEKERQSWDPGILAILQKLKRIVVDEKLDPLIATEVRSGVSWHSTYSKTKTKEIATDVVDKIPTKLPYELTRALVDGWGWTFERADRDYHAEESSLSKWRKKVATKLIKKFENNIEGLVSLLEKRLNTINESKYDRHIEPEHFLDILLSQSIELTRFLAEHLLNNLESPLMSWFHVAIMAIAKSNREEAVELCQRAVDTNNKKLMQGVASALGYGSHNISILDKEILLMRKLAKDSDQWVRRTIIRAFERFKPEEKPVALEILLSIDITDLTEVASKVLGEFDDKYGSFKIEELSEEQLGCLLNNLVKTPSIDDYHIRTFLSKLSVHKPKETLLFLKSRVEYKEANSKIKEYLPFPHSWGKSDEIPRFYETPHYEDMLREVRDWAAESTDSWIRFYFGSDLLKFISAGFDDVTLKILGEWLFSPNEREMKVASSLLAKGGMNFVWNNEKYVVNLLEEADRLGPSYYKQITHALYLTVVQGGKNGKAGEPFPEDIKQRDISFERMSKLPAGSPAHRFYKMLNEVAKAEISRQIEMFENWEE